MGREDECHDECRMLVCDIIDLNFTHGFFILMSLMFAAASIILYSLIQPVSSGRLWTIGGSPYRPIAARANCLNC